MSGKKKLEKRELNPASSGDAKSGPQIDVQSIITQVDRNAAPVTIPTTSLQSSESSSASTNGHEKPIRGPFSLFSRLFCCGSSTGTLPQNIQMGSVPTNHSAPSGRGSTGSTRNQPPTVVPAMQHYPLPLRMPEMPISDEHRGKKCLALDLDETLVHSSFQPVDPASFVITVLIDGNLHKVYVIKRPGVDEFIERMSKYYELVIYTASLSKYADPLLDILDPEHRITTRLFRENCVFYEGHYVKDLSLLQRDISQTIIVDNSPMSYIFHPENAIDCVSFFDNPADFELWQIADFLESIRSSEDVRPFCRNWRDWCQTLPTSVPPHMLKHQQSSP